MFQPHSDEESEYQGDAFISFTSGGIGGFFQI
jgi:hypothetical protein